MADTSYQKTLREQAKTLETAGAHVIALIPAVVDVSVITSERGAHDTVDGVLIVEKEGKTALQVYDSQARMSKLKLDALAAYLQHSLLYSFSEIRLNDTTAIALDELYVFAQKVTEAAAIALAIRGESTVISHLTPGRQCARCRSAYRCPTLTAMV